MPLFSAMHSRNANAKPVGVEIEPWIRLLRRHARLLIGLPLILGIVTALVSLLLPTRYTAVAKFVSQSAGSQNSGMLSAIPGLSQLGISLGSQFQRTAALSAKVLNTRDILDTVLLSRYSVRGNDRVGKGSTTLFSALGFGDVPSADRLEEARKQLLKRTRVEVDDQTSVLQVSVTNESPELAAWGANRFVQSLNHFNLRTRQEEGRARTEFARQILAEAEQSLRDAEDQLSEFASRNRSLGTQALQLEQARLQRRISLRQEVYVTITHELESARMQELNTVPMITMLEVAIPPRHKSYPKRAFMISVAAALGCLLSLVWILGTSYLQRKTLSGENENTVDIPQAMT